VVVTVAAEVRVAGVEEARDDAFFPTALLVRVPAVALTLPAVLCLLRIAEVARVGEAGAAAVVAAAVVVVAVALTVTAVFVNVDRLSATFTRNVVGVPAVKYTGVVGVGGTGGRTVWSAVEEEGRGRPVWASGVAARRMDLVALVRAVRGLFPLLASRIALPASCALTDPLAALAIAAVVLFPAVFSCGLNFRPVMASGDVALGFAGMEAQYSMRSTNCRAWEGGRGFTASSFGRYCVRKGSKQHITERVRCSTIT
jgi:hypothetical protein